MKKSEPHYQRCILFCDHSREDGGECCAPEGGLLRAQLKEMIAQRGLKRQVRVSRTGCLGFCKNGPHALIMPDNIWLSEIDESDIDDILTMVLKDVPQAADGA